jgi:hypothetical protein
MPPGSVFLLTAHHIALDGWSLDVMLRDLGVLYDRRVKERRVYEASATRETREETKQGGDEGGELTTLSLPRLHVRVTDLASAYKGESFLCLFTCLSIFSVLSRCGATHM